MFHHYIFPLAPYLLIALNSLLCLMLSLYFGSEMRTVKERMRVSRMFSDPATQEFRAKLNELTLRVQDVEQRAGIDIVPRPPRGTFNLNKRTQVMRMSRRGERPENIASSLSIPRREVELLIKVQRLIVDDSGKLT